MSTENEKEEKKFDVNELYNEIFGNNLLFPKQWKPVILIGLMKAHQAGHAEGYAAGKRVESIRHINFLESNAFKLMNEKQL